MILFEDTRNPIAKHRNVHAYCDIAGIRIERTKLYVGDYTLPTNQTICIDTKAGLGEVYDNVLLDSKRFRHEAAKAKAAKIKLIVLVEEAGINNLCDVVAWSNPRKQQWNAIRDAHSRGKMLNVEIASSPPASSVKLAKKMSKISREYGIEWRFCSKAETGAEIIKLLTGEGTHEDS